MKLRGGKIHRRSVGITRVVEGARARHQGTTSSINTRDTDSTSDDDLFLSGIEPYRSVYINTRFVALPFFLDDGERTLKHCESTTWSISSLEGEIERLLIARIPDELQAGVLTIHNVFLDNRTKIVRGESFNINVKCDFLAIARLLACSRSRRRGLIILTRAHPHSQSYKQGRAVNT